MMGVRVTSELKDQDGFPAQSGDHVIADLRSRRKPRMFVISGPSGVGKDAVIKLIRDVFPEIHVAVTATTRERRPGEANGVDYFFFDTHTFANHLALGEFLESATVYGQSYGVPKQSVRHALERGQDVIIKVDVQGAATIRSQVHDAIFIFVSPVSSAELLQRLRNRKTDDPDSLMRRFAEAERELHRANEFDYVVFNGQTDHGQPDVAVAQIQSIIEAERHRLNQTPIEI
ncbi:guanylate kinase [soil metagenome]